MGEAQNLILPIVEFLGQNLVWIYTRSIEQLRAVDILKVVIWCHNNLQLLEESARWIIHAHQHIVVDWQFALRILAKLIEEMNQGSLNHLLSYLRCARRTCYVFPVFGL